MVNPTEKVLISIFLLFISSVLTAGNNSADKATKINIVNGAPQKFCKTAGHNLTSIIQEMNRAVEENDSLNMTIISKYCSKYGQVTVPRFFNETRVYIEPKEYNFNLISFKTFKI